MRIASGIIDHVTNKAENGLEYTMSCQMVTRQCDVYQGTKGSNDLDNRNIPQTMLLSGQYLQPSACRTFNRAQIYDCIILVVC